MAETLVVTNPYSMVVLELEHTVDLVRALIPLCHSKEDLSATLLDALAGRADKYRQVERERCGEGE